VKLGDNPSSLDCFSTRFVFLIFLFLLVTFFSMPPSYFPLRWEGTGDHWWYVSPIDYAAANGHYDLVRELLRIDNNHLINLSSLRRIRRLETVWDDDEQFDDVARCRSRVALKLLHECETKNGKNSLIRAGYGGWLLYTAASAGDLFFVQELLQRDPLLVFGEGEYGVTDILYAAARSKNSEVFRIIFDFAVSPRFLTARGEMEEHLGEIPPAYKWEMMNRAVHAAARGGNLSILKELLVECSDVLAYRDVQGSTILHAAAGRGQVEVVKHLIASYNMISSTDNQGNAALHIAAYRGQFAVLEALIQASPSSIFTTNNAGDTLLHMAVSGFQTPGFRRLDQQIELMKQLVCGQVLNMESIINAKNNEGRTALHLAIIGNIQSNLVELLMTVPSINVNIRDVNGMTPLDLLRQRPQSASSEILIKQLISAGAIFSCQNTTARRAIASRLKMQGVGSPGTSFKISDTEIFLQTGIEISSDGSIDQGSPDTNRYSTEHYHFYPTDEKHSPLNQKKQSPINYAAKRLKTLLHLPRNKNKKSIIIKKFEDENSSGSYKKSSKFGEPHTPLRHRFSKPSSLPNNKRTLSVRSNLPSPSYKKKIASGLKRSVMQAMPHLNAQPGHSASSSFSRSSLSSPKSLEKQKGIYRGNDDAGPSFSNSYFHDEMPNLFRKTSVSKKTVNSYCFGSPGLSSAKDSADRLQVSHSYKPSLLSAA
ncbi:Ankyrin repeat, partial [Dillenia turbinata]